MNNREALEFLKSKTSVRDASTNFMDDHHLGADQYHKIRYQFGELKDSRELYRKKNDLNTWEEFLFYDSSKQAVKRRLSSDGEVLETEKAREIRKPLLELTIKGQRARLEPLISFMSSLAEKENIHCKTLAALALQLVSASSGDYSTSSFCQEIVRTGTFQKDTKRNISIEKSTFLLSQLEIGKRKYIDLKRVCKSEGVIFAKYKDISQFRSQITLDKEFILILNTTELPIGIGISYISIMRQTISRLLQTLSPVMDIQFPLTFTASDGLDGSGSHQIYNQLQETQQFNCKSFILFAFKPLAIRDCNDNLIWSNQTPNSQFQIRPVALLAAKENEDNVRHLMDTYINPLVSELQENGITFPQGIVKVKLVRSMFDGKMAGLLSGAGGAHCQLCTATFKQLHDLELIREGFPINRSISAAKEIFDSVNKEEFLSLASNDRFGLTHEPVSDIDILCASPLHAYTCIFRWFMTLVYHLQSGTRKWSPSSIGIKNSMKFTSGLLMEKTGMKIDQPSSDGGTTSTGNIARLCFLDKNEFLFWVNSLIPSEHHNTLKMIHTNLSVILRIYNSK